MTDNKKTKSQWEQKMETRGIFGSKVSSISISTFSPEMYTLDPADPEPIILWSRSALLHFTQDIPLEACSERVLQMMEKNRFPENIIFRIDKVIIIYQESILTIMIKWDNFVIGFMLRNKRVSYDSIFVPQGVDLTEAMMLNICDACNRFVAEVCEFEQKTLPVYNGKGNNINWLEKDYFECDSFALQYIDNITCYMRCIPKCQLKCLYNGSFIYFETIKPPQK